MGKPICWSKFIFGITDVTDEQLEPITKFIIRKVSLDCY